MKERYLLTCFLFLIGWTTIQAQGTRQARLNKLIENDLPSTSEVGICVYDLTDQKQIYAYRENKLSRPASTMKLLTVITALAQPSGKDPFVTEVWYKGSIEQHILLGDLYIVGGFDPEFSDEEMDSLIEQIRSLSITSIKGKIYGDITMKDSLYWGNGWAWDDNPSSFQPYLSPLIFHKGMVKITAKPSAVKGDTAQLICNPVSSFYTVCNKTKTNEATAGKFCVSRDWLENKNNIIVTGNVTNRQSGEVNMCPSQDFFMHTFIERLQRKGVTIEDGYGYSEFGKDSAAVRIARIECPVQKVIEQIMKESDNLNAEALLCKLAVGYTGHKKVSATDGLSAIKDQMKQLGYAPSDFKIADGCGLSNYNYLSPALLVGFLKFAYSRPDIFQQLYPSLPVSGTDGTLQYRMKKESAAYMKVNAKTGSFTGICTLAGYLKTSKGHHIAFAIMNQNALSLPKARAFQNKVCEMLCGE